MEHQRKQRPYSVLLAAISLFTLAIIYVFQRWDYLNSIGRVLGVQAPAGPAVTFVFNKALRLIMNDALCLLLIFALFRERKYLRVAFFVFCFEFFLILPVYLAIKLKTEGSSEISSPLLSQIHRLIVNPMLMFILIVAFYYQRYSQIRKT